MCYEHRAVDMLRRGRLPAAKDGGEGHREEGLPENGAQTVVSHLIEKVKQTHPWMRGQAHMCGGKKKTTFKWER